jgi:NADH-quinone oxidoreductase subunit M
VASLEDINRPEFIVLALLAAAVLLVGVWPNPLLEVMHVTVDNLLELATRSKL